MKSTDTNPEAEPSPERGASQSGKAKPGRIRRWLRVRLARQMAWVAAAWALGAVLGGTIGALGGVGKAIAWLSVIGVPALLGAAALVGQLAPQDERVEPVLRKVLRAAVLCIGLLALAAGILEVRYRDSHPLPALRLSTPDKLTYLQRPDPELSWRGAPNFTQRMEFQTGDRHFRTNSRGFRDIEQAIDPNRPRVVVLGDSFPVAWGTDVENGIVAHLRQKIPETQLFNASWQGYGKDQMAWSYKVLARDLQPKVVIMMFVANPMADTSLPIYDGIRKPHYVLDGDDLLLRGKPVKYQQGAQANARYYSDWHRARITNPLAALRYLTGDFVMENSALGRRILIGRFWRRVRELGLPTINAIEARILRRLRNEIHADGGRLILLPMPRGELFERLEDPVAAMRPYLEGYRKIGIETIDVTPLLQKDSHTCFDPSGLHPNLVAIQRIVDTVSERVKAALH